MCCLPAVQVYLVQYRCLCLACIEKRDNVLNCAVIALFRPGSMDLPFECKLAVLTRITNAMQLFDMGASGVGPVLKKAEMPRVMVDTEKGKEHLSSFICFWLGLKTLYTCTSSYLTVEILCNI